MNNGDKIFADAIKRLRKEKGLTQHELADIIGVRKTTVSNYEIEYSTPNLSVLRKLIDAFDLPITYFTSAPTICKKKEIQNMFGNSMPYFSPKNVEGLLTGDLALRDSLVNFPKTVLAKGGKYLTTCAPDNSMNKANIRVGDFIMINTIAKIEDGKIIAFTLNNNFMIRRFSIINSQKMLVAESTKIPKSASAKEFDDNTNVIGIVEKVMSDL